LTVAAAGSTLERAGSRAGTIKEEAMTSRQRFLGGLAAVLIAAAAFGIGDRVGSDGATRPPVLVGDGYVGSDVALFQVGDTVYGFRSSVNWTDSAGSYHDQGWPACLPQLEAVTGVHFVAQTVWADGTAATDIVWVDCRGR
jgi:hypothetical protein